MSDRQKQVLKAWVETGCTKQAADRLGMTLKGVQWHLEKIRRSLGFRPLIWLAIWTYKHGIGKPL